MATPKLGSLIIEGKTKRVFDLPQRPGCVFVESKDRITAGDGVKAHDLEGKAAISTATTAKVFELLNAAGQYKMEYWVRGHSMWRTVSAATV